MSHASKSIFFILLASFTHTIVGMTSLDYYDPFPLYTTADIHEFLYTSDRDRIRGIVPELKDERANVTLTPFGQWSKIGKRGDFLPQAFYVTTAADTTATIPAKFVQLGDLGGLWNMLALTYSTCPDQSMAPLLEEAGNIPFCRTDPEILFNDPEAFENQTVYENTGPDFGLVSVPLVYRKHGFRAETSVMILDDLGFKAQFGAAEIQQIVKAFIDQSQFDIPPTGDSCRLADECCQETNLLNVTQNLTGTDAIKSIAPQIGLDISDFRKIMAEDLRLQFFWRHAINFDYGDNWSKFLLMPFLQVIGTVACSPEKNPNKMFARSAGNNGHHAIGFNGGLALDFEGTVEFIAEGGVTFFASRTQTLRMPNNQYQSGIYPCTATACVNPGLNFHAIGTIYARRFLEMLSGQVQIAWIKHEPDTIKVKQATKVFLPENLEQYTPWNIALLNVGLNYEITKNMSLGFLWQIPIHERGAPRTNTLLGSLVANF